VDSPRDSHPFKAETTLSSAPSTVLAKLAKMNSSHIGESSSCTIERSSGFSERAARKHIAEEDASGRAPKRGDDLALIEDLEPDPYDHKAPFDDPHFQKLEPHSGIRLSYVVCLAYCCNTHSITQLPRNTARRLSRLSSREILPFSIASILCYSNFT
jgi:hypothetical protein